jgi:hypothetical protein
VFDERSLGFWRANGEVLALVNINLISNYILISSFNARGSATETGMAMRSNAYDLAVVPPLPTTESWVIVQANAPQHRTAGHRDGEGT